MFYALCHALDAQIFSFPCVDVWVYMFTCLISCLWLCFMLLYLCLDLHVCTHVLCSYTYVYAFTCLYAWICVLPSFYAYIHTLGCTFTCLHAYLHGYMHRSVYLHAQINAFYMLYAISHMLACFMPCLCAQAQTFFVMPCAIIALLFHLSYFLVFWPNGSDPIQTLWSLSSSMYHGPYQKGLDHSYLHVYACLLLCFMLVLASLVLGFAMFGALRELNLVWLHSMPMRLCSDVTIWEASPDAKLLHAYPSFFPLHAMLCLPCLFVPPVGFLCIFTCLLTCSCISLACQCVVHTSTQ